MMLYRAIKLPSNEPVQYVGVYVLRWGKVDQPTVGFVEDKTVPDLLAALAPFAALYHKRFDSLDDDVPLYQHDQAVIRVGDVRRAKNAVRLNQSEFSVVAPGP